MKLGIADGDVVVERRKVNLQGMIGKDKRKEKRGSWGGEFGIWNVNMGQIELRRGI